MKAWSFAPQFIDCRQPDAQVLADRLIIKAVGFTRQFEFPMERFIRHA